MLRIWYRVRHALRTVHSLVVVDLLISNSVGTVDDKRQRRRTHATTNHGATHHHLHNRTTRIDFRGRAHFTLKRAISSFLTTVLKVLTVAPRARRQSFFYWRFARLRGSYSKSPKTKQTPPPPQE
uniref:Putative secreted protein n=1 Tax=Anopheles marajoara TaxID=58244 RepID=A0A2M4C861_9DIPT